MASSSNGQSNLAQIAETILREQIDNIIQELIIFRHRDHKMMIANLDTETKLPHCERCNLPRLLEPPLAPSVRGATSDPPISTVYCDKKPWCRKPGHDIYGNPFPKGDVTGRPPSKKEREAAKNSQKNGTDTPASNEGGEPNGTAPPSPSQDGDGATAKASEKLEKGEKKASKIDEKLKKGEYIPWQTCPSCKRSLLITRFAKHLEQCMGLSGRAASRNAMAKMNGNGSGSGATPAGSRGGTPGPDGKDGGEDDEDDEKVKGPGAVRKKLLKKATGSKIKLSSKDGKLSMTNGKSAKPLTSSVGGSADGKRDRDEAGDDDGDEENVHVKKRQKLTRVESQASIASASTAPPPSAVDMDRGESNDGSFVDDGASFVDE